MLLEGVAIVIAAVLAAFWFDSVRARERATLAGRNACARYGLQFLDETVSCTRLTLARDEDGRVRLARTYAFEFSDTGNNRLQGAVRLMGARLQDLHFEPYRAQ